MFTIWITTIRWYVNCFSWNRIAPHYIWDLFGCSLFDFIFIVAQRKWSKLVPLELFAVEITEINTIWDAAMNNKTFVAYFIADHCCYRQKSEQFFALSEKLSAIFAKLFYTICLECGCKVLVSFYAFVFINRKIFSFIILALSHQIWIINLNTNLSWCLHDCRDLKRLD